VGKALSNDKKTWSFLPILYSIAELIQARGQNDRIPWSSLKMERREEKRREEKRRGEKRRGEKRRVEKRREEKRRKEKRREEKREKRREEI
jgi:hypothetical protein